MPSVESMAMHRTTLSPMSDATSSTTIRPSAVFTSSASNSSGWSPGSNWTSVTAPMTWLIRPCRVARRLLRQGRDQFRIAEQHCVGVAPRVLLQRDRHRRQHLAWARPVREVADLRDHAACVAKQKIAALAADGHVLLLARVVLVHVPRRGADVVDVDRAAQAFVWRDKEHHCAAAPAADR